MGRKVFLLSIVLMFLFVGCTQIVQQTEAYPEAEKWAELAVYEFAFDIESVSGVGLDNWQFSFTYGDTEIISGQCLTFPAGVFSFQSIGISVTERGAEGAKFITTFPVAVCDGGSGRTEVTVTGENGAAATFRIVCNVKLIQTGS